MGKKRGGMGKKESEREKDIEKRGQEKGREERRAEDSLVRINPCCLEKHSASANPLMECGLKDWPRGTKGRNKERRQTEERAKRNKDWQE